MAYGRHPLLSGLAAALLALTLLPTTGQAEEGGKESQDEELKKLQQDKAVLEAQNDYYKQLFPSLSELPGKEGALTQSTVTAPSFHVTRRAAQAFDAVAQEISELTKAALAKCTSESVSDASPQPPCTKVALVSNRDVNAALATSIAIADLARLLEVTDKYVPPDPDEEPPAREDESEHSTMETTAAGVSLFAIGSFLAQVASLSKMARTDSELITATTALVDELLLDPLAMKLGSQVVYPGAGWPVFVTDIQESEFSFDLDSLRERRDLITKAGDSGKADLALVEAFLTRMAAADAQSQLPALLTILHGEKVIDALNDADFLVLSVGVLQQGGSTLKTSSIWRNDRLYASGGVIARHRLYRLDRGEMLNSGVVASETDFESIPLVSRRDQRSAPVSTD